jgi:nitrogen fixation NifU-like protein
MTLPKKVVEHFQNPQNVGQIGQPDALGSINNPVCGDITELYLRIENDTIKDAKFKSFGCAVTIASASVFTEQLKDRSLSQLFSGTDEAVVRRLVHMIEDELGELPLAKLHCPPATVQAFLEAIQKYSEEQGNTALARRMPDLIPVLKAYYERTRH